MNRVSHLIVAKDVAATGTAGFVRVVKPDGTAVSPGETISDVPVIYIEQDLTATTTLMSPPIDGRYVSGWTGKSNAAATAQVTYVGNITSGVLDIETSNSTEYTLYITVLNEKDGHTIPWSYKYTTDATATSLEIATAFRNAVNASLFLNNDYHTITAAVTNSTTYYGISLTGGTGAYATSFEVSLSDAFGATTITESALYEHGAGNYPQTYDLETIALGYRGFATARMDWGDKFSSPTRYVDITEGYDIYCIDFGRGHDEQYINSTKVAPLHLDILVPVPSTFPQSTFETIINPWMASTPGAFPPVTL